MRHRNSDQVAPALQNAKNLVRRIRTRSGFLTFSETIDATTDGPVPLHYLAARDFGPPVSGRRIVDVGCWTGKFLRLLAPEHPMTMAGIDVVGPWLAVAQRSNPKATFVPIDSIEEIPQNLNHAYDTVYFLETLEHLPRDLEHAAANSLKNLLSPDGVLILSVPVAGLAALLDPAWYLVGHRHYRRKRLIDILQTANLTIDEYAYSGSAWESLDTILLYIYKHLLQRPYLSPKFLSVRLSTRLSCRRHLGSTGIWIRARCP